MSESAAPRQAATKEAVVARVRELAASFRERAEEGERARTLPRASARELIEAGLARALVPRRFGGSELGLDTWIEVVRETSKADASHGWCAGLLMHVAHMVTFFPEKAQKTVWADGPDVPFAGSVLPVCEVTPEDGGYRISGQSPFASGVAHATWVMVAGLVFAEGPPQWMLFLVPAGEYQILDTWFTAGMQATGSNVIVTENVFVPAERTLRLSDLVNGTAPGGPIHENPMYRLPFMSYAPAGFVMTMLGAAQGAFEDFRNWAAERRLPTGERFAEIASTQTRLARAAATLDAADMLVQRAISVAQSGEPLSLELRARAIRDYSRASELTIEAVDALIAMSGTAGFSSSSPLQRAWRDIHFAAAHISLNPEINYSHWGRTELGVERPPTMLFY